MLNYGSGFGDYSAIREASAEQQQRLAPLSLEDEAAVYCVQPCADMAPDALTFDNGMELVGHSLLRSADGASVFLRWQTGAPLPDSYKVSVRLMDAIGNVVAQVDNVPQLWSRPTNTWKPGEVIEDFYRLESKGEIAQGAVVVYDAQSGQAVAAQDKTGQRFGPLINLGGG